VSAVWEKTMANHRHTYTLYSRPSKSGGKIWYYMTYTPDGVRTGGKSTWCESKTAARNYCDDLLKRGLLYTGINQTFGQYALGWFDNGSAWLQDRMAIGTVDHPALSESTLKRFRSDLKNHILPYFEHKKLQEIKPSDVKHFRTWLMQEQKMSPKSVNNIMSTIKIITDYALADNAILFDPLRGIRPMIVNNKIRDAFSIDEAKRIFSAAWMSQITKAANLTAACTGMRMSEILAIKKENLHETYIDLTNQVYRGKVCPLKTKAARKVPITPQLYRILKPLAQNGYAFGSVDAQRIYIHLRNVMTGLHMDKERVKRNLCFHSWRHFCNTFLLAENVPPVKVAAVLGHSTGAGSMQERYTNWSPDMFPEVYAAQAKLIKMLQL